MFLHTKLALCLILFCVDVRYIHTNNPFASGQDTWHSCRMVGKFFENLVSKGRSPEVYLFCRCYIARYTDVWNRHRESEIHDIHEIGSGTKLYKRLFDMRRERHNLSMLTAFTSAPNHVRSPLQTTGLATASHESQPSSSEVGTQLIAFSQIPQILSRRFQCMTSFTPPGPISYTKIFILTSMNDTSSMRAREHLH